MHYAQITVDKFHTHMHRSSSVISVTSGFFLNHVVHALNVLISPIPY